MIDAHAANWPVFAPPQWPAFTPPLTTGNVAIEKAALAAAVRFSYAVKIDVYFIFTDGSAISARELDHGVKWDGPWRGRGSNTPFWLFQKGDTRPCLDFEAVYPAELIACDWADLVWVTREEIAAELASLRGPGSNPDG